MTWPGHQRCLTDATSYLGMGNPVPPMQSKDFLYDVGRVARLGSHKSRYTDCSVYRTLSVKSQVMVVKLVVRAYRRQQKLKQCDGGSYH